MAGQVGFARSDVFIFSSLIIRFIIQNFYDTLRQHVFDMMQGRPIQVTNIDDSVGHQLLGVLTDNLPIQEMNHGYAYRGVMGTEQEQIEALIFNCSR